MVVTEIPMDDLVPHREPMSLIERLLEAGDKVSVGEVRIDAMSRFLEDGVVPAYVGIEYMAQTVAAHGGFHTRAAGKPIEPGFLLGAPRFQSHCDAFTIGMVLHVRVEEVWGESELHRFKCTIHDAATGDLLQDADLNVFRPRNVGAFLKGDV